MEINLEKIKEGKLFEIEEDGDDFTYLLKIINLTEKPMSCTQLNIDTGLLRHSDSIYRKFKRVEAKGCLRIRMRKSDLNEKTLQSLADNELQNFIDYETNKKKEDPFEEKKPPLEEDPSQEKKTPQKEDPSQEKKEELKGVVTYNLDGHLINIAFSNKKDGTNNILIEGSSEEDSCINRLNEKGYEKHFLVTKDALVNDVFTKGHYYTLKIDSEDLISPLIIKYGVTSAKPEEELVIIEKKTKEEEEEKKKKAELSLYTISDRDAVAVVIVDIDKALIEERKKEKEEEEKEEQKSKNL